jgi:uncharacterized protein YkwD
MRALLALLTLALAALPLAPAAPAQAQADPAAELLALANQARVAGGLLPLRASQELAAAAQRHSDDLAAAGALSHTGSDGSRPDGRIRSAGLPSLRRRGPVRQRTSSRRLAEAVEWWLGDASSQGICQRTSAGGVSLATGAGGEIYFTMTWGRPNSLPVFIAGDAPDRRPGSRLALSNETVQPGGEHRVVGRATEVRISNEPGFRARSGSRGRRRSGGRSRPARPKTIYVQFRDAGPHDGRDRRHHADGRQPAAARRPARATAARRHARRDGDGRSAPAVTAVRGGHAAAGSQPGTPAASPESGGAGLQPAVTCRRPRWPQPAACRC